MAGSKKYQVATDDEQDQILKGRMRQLELEHFGMVLQQQEETADEQVSDTQRDQTGKVIKSLEARMDAVYKALNARPKRPADESQPAEQK